MTAYRWNGTDWEPIPNPPPKPRRRTRGKLERVLYSNESTPTRDNP